MAIAFPTAASVGEKYVENDKVWEWNGVAWDKKPKGDVQSSEVAPSLPYDGQLWIDINSGSNYYYDSNNGWVQLNSGGVDNPAIPINSAMVIGAASAPQTRTELIHMTSGSITTNGSMQSNRVQSVAGSDYYNAMVIWGGTNTNIEKISFSSGADATILAQADINNMSVAAAGAGNNRSLIVNKAMDMTNISGTSLFRYSHSNGTEYTHGNLNVARGYCAATANYTDVLFISGSRNTNAWLNSIEKVQIVANSTALQLNDMTVARTVPSAVNDFDNVLVGYGNLTGNTGTTNSFMKMNFASESQEEFIPSDPVSGSAIGRKGAKSAANYTDALFIGGRNDANVGQTAVSQINFDSLSYTEGYTTLSEGLANHCATYGN